VRKLIVVLTIGLVVFIVVNRQRLFVLDPLATVTRDGGKVPDVRVLINDSNDVLLLDRSTGSLRLAMVQHWNKVAESPTRPLRCLSFFVCLTDADRATASPLPVGSRGGRPAVEAVTMTDRRVEFVNQPGGLVGIALR